MADQRSVMKEYRLLEQKRQSGGLTAQEEARFAQLRELVGPDTGMGASRPGFDVNAAAARLRESLLPAGLRNRPASMPEPPPPEPPAPEPEAAAPQLGASGLEAVWNAAPFAPLTEQPGLTEEGLFDPGSLGTDAPAEPAWDPNAQPYDAGTQPWDPNAQPYDPNAQPYYDPNAPQQWDAGAQGWDANAQPYDANAQPYDPNAPQQQWDAGAQGWDANAQPYDPNAQPYDPNAPQQWDQGAEQQWDAAVQPAWDPNLAAPWGEPAGTETPTEIPAEPAAEPMAEAAAMEGVEAEWGAEPVPGEPAAAEAPSWELEATPAGEAAPVEPDAWDVSALSSGEAAGLPPEPGFEEPAQPFETPAEPSFELPAEPLEAIPEPSFEAPLTAPFEAAPEPAFDLPMEEAPSAPEEPPLVEPLSAEPSEPEAEELLPFDAGAASAIGAGALPEGWGAAEPTVELTTPEPSFDAGYGDLSPEPPAQTDALPADEAQGLLAPLGAGQELTSDDDAFAQGFHLESNGSFGKTVAPAAPAEPTWSAQPQPAEGEEWESAPSLDLAAMAPIGGVPHLDLGAPAAEPHAPPMGLGPQDALDEVEVEEIPVVEGSELLEELPPEPPPPELAADVRVEGTHRVVVHTVEGLVKRGVIADVSLDADTLPLAPQPDAAPEQLPTPKIKAIFFMLAAGEKAPAAEGKKVRVTFSDGRQVAGFSPDYSDAGPGFFMIPADTRTNTGRIWVYRSAVKTVTVS